MDIESRLKLLRTRRSVRTYSDDSVSQEIINTLKAEITFINTHESGMHFQIFTDDSSPFDGFRRSYGFFSNARNFIAAVVDTSFPDIYERAGYFAEQIVMKAVGLGLGTCFVGGTYDSRYVPVILRVDRVLLFLIVFGYASNMKERWLEKMGVKFLHRKDKNYTSYYSNPPALDEALSMQPSLDVALKALVTAPSSMNKRPVRLTLVNGKISAFVPTPNKTSLIDLGIAKYNIAYALNAEELWEWGNHGILEI